MTPIDTVQVQDLHGCRPGGQMPYDKGKHHRRSIRLPGYDYRWPGTYFVTICVQGGECLLGQVVDGAMHLNRFGQVAGHYWKRIPNHAPHVGPDE